MKFELRAQKVILRQNVARRSREHPKYLARKSRRNSKFSKAKRRCPDEDDDNDDIERHAVF